MTQNAQQDGAQAPQEAPQQAPAVCPRPNDLTHRYRDSYARGYATADVRSVLSRLDAARRYPHDAAYHVERAHAQLTEALAVLTSECPACETARQWAVQR